MTTTTDTIQTPAIDALLRNAHALVAQELILGYRWRFDDAARWHELRNRVESVERDFYLYCQNVLSAMDSIATAKQTAENAINFLTDLEMLAAQMGDEGEAETLECFHDDARQMALLLAGDEDYLGEWGYLR